MLSYTEHSQGAPTVMYNVVKSIVLSYIGEVV